MRTIARREKIRRRRTKVEIELERSVIPADCAKWRSDKAIELANFSIYHSRSIKLEYGAHFEHPKGPAETARIRQRFLDAVRWNIANIHDPPLTAAQRQALHEVRQAKADRDAKEHFLSLQRALGNLPKEEAPPRRRARRVRVKGPEFTA